jgi:hypothetical protein
LNDAEYRQPAPTWIELWSAIAGKPWEFKTTDLVGHSHMSALPAAFREGMQWLFSNDYRAEKSE